MPLAGAVAESNDLHPHQYVIRQHVERAKRLLKDGKMGILEGAIACRFIHQSHLSHHFKRFLGLPSRQSYKILFGGAP